MANELREISVYELFNGEKCTYQVPIYQRNYAWEKDEIEALVNDVYDAFKKNQNTYYIGTLVSYRRDDNVFEVIDGQQRLTTIRIILSVMRIKPNNKLTYRARRKSDRTLELLDTLDKYVEDKDSGIENGRKYAEEALEHILKSTEKDRFIKFFNENVYIIHYIVPRDIDLNHYFEVMNSRGEQLEKHEIVKAWLMEKLDSDESRYIFNKIWQACSQMSVYIQDSLDFGDKTAEIFSNELNDFKPNDFSFFLKYAIDDKGKDKKTIIQILDETTGEVSEEKELADTFQPIIDFPNFLLIVLKITRMSEAGFSPTDFILDDKELLNEFTNIKDAGKMDSIFSKNFAFNLLKAKFFLDNYIVHHAVEDETVASNPWQLETYTKSGEREKKHRKNLCNDDNIQDKLVQLLSMFEVSFTARQRKNYLFYCLYYLMTTSNFKDTKAYSDFVENLADTYFEKIYLEKNLLNQINTPIPGSFDQMLLKKAELAVYPRINPEKTNETFVDIYGNGTEKSNGIALFVFNYLDYKIWKLYAQELRGEKLKEGSKERDEFFKNRLGCNDFGLDVFKNFYFSRTRRSLEHYYPQANATGENDQLNQNEINCFGNYAMIGAQANSSGSNWTPKVKLDHYLDSSGKINQISVASLKFMIMMQICKDNAGKRSSGDEWNFEDIQSHQEKMMDILLK